MPTPANGTPAAPANPVEPAALAQDGTAPPESDTASGTTEPAPPNEIKLLVPSREFLEEGPEGAVRVSYDDLDLLKVINMEPVTEDAPKHFPDWLRNLDGRRIRLRGFMFPPPIAEGLPFFVLARDNQICCFGRNPKAYDIIPVIMRKGVTTDYINGRPFDVVGVFHIRIEMSLDDETKVESLYVIEDAVVIDKDRS